MFLFYGGYNTWENVFLNIMAILVIIIFWWVFYSFIYAIFLFIFSKWNEEKIKKAWNSIRYWIIWIILTLIILFVAPFILKELHVPGYRIYTAKNIFDRATVIVKKVFKAFSKEGVNNFTPGSSYDDFDL